MVYFVDEKTPVHSGQISKMNGEQSGERESESYENLKRGF